MTKVEIETGGLGRQSAVLLDGEDIAKKLHGIQLTVEAGSPTELVLLMRPGTEVSFAGDANVAVHSTTQCAEDIRRLDPDKIMEEALDLIDGVSIHTPGQAFFKVLLERIDGAQS